MKIEDIDTWKSAIIACDGYAVTMYAKDKSEEEKEKIRNAYCADDFDLFIIENLPELFKIASTISCRWNKYQLFIKKIFKENLIEKAEEEFGFTKCLVFKK